MRNGTQALLGNEFAGLAADAVGLVLYADEGCLKVLYVFHLSLSESAKLLFAECGGTFFEHFESGGSIVNIVAVAGYHLAQLVVLPLRFLKFLIDELTELFEFCIRITYLLFHGM